ncbi:MAG: HEAT repeat domain-containing protein [Planctomycetia bacterium]|nr:HEAT repeat domain-containing protein [Planctomycetia bacterium]
MKNKFCIYCMYTGLLMVLMMNVGCNNLFLRDSGSKEIPRMVKKPRLVGDVAVPFGLERMEITGVCLAVNLPGTGSDPPESWERTKLLKDMSGRQVENKNELLASPNTSLVFATGELRPGVRKGDRFDIMVTLPPQSETTSLRGGYLMEARMRDLVIIDRVREGRDRGKCSGPIIVDPKTGTENDVISQKQGKVLSGGVSLIDRPIGLRTNLDMKRRDTRLTRDIEAAINKRFTINGQKMAKAKDDKHLELKIHPLYKDYGNSIVKLERYLDVIRCLPLRETDKERLERLASLEKRLHDATTTRRAALELEALGKAGIDILKTGLKSSDIAVQFHSAQALAYLDVSESAEVLGRIAETESSYRAYALAALSSLGDLYADEELRRLMNANTAETRYGAFRALTEMKPDDPLIKGVSLGNNTFTLCTVDSTGSQMVHVTRSVRAEIVIFGRDLRFQTPFAVAGTNNVVVRADTPEEVVISKFGADIDQKRVVSPRVEEVIHALSEVGATYPDVIEVLQEMVAQGALPTSAFRVDALPKKSRKNNYETPDKNVEKKD